MAFVSTDQVLCADGNQRVARFPTSLRLTDCILTDWEVMRRMRVQPPMLPRSFQRPITASLTSGRHGATTGVPLVRPIAKRRTGADRAFSDSTLTGFRICRWLHGVTATIRASGVAHPTTTLDTEEWWFLAAQYSVLHFGHRHMAPPTAKKGQNQWNA